MELFIYHSQCFILKLLIYTVCLYSLAPEPSLRTSYQQSGELCSFCFFIVHALEATSSATPSSIPTAMWVSELSQLHMRKSPVLDEFDSREVVTETKSQNFNWHYYLVVLSREPWRWRFPRPSCPTTRLFGGRRRGSISRVSGKGCLGCISSLIRERLPQKGIKPFLALPFHRQMAKYCALASFSIFLLSLSLFVSLFLS